MSPAVTVAPKTPRLLAAGALVLTAALWLPATTAAQDAQAEPPQPGEQTQSVEGETRAPAYIASLDGAVSLDREGRNETAERGMPLVAGDRLRTEAGRVEIAFPNGSQIFVDRYTDLDLGDPLSVRLSRGRLYVRLQATIDAAERIIVDAPGASVQFHDDGEYRIAVGGADAVEVELVVLRGQASLESDGGNVLVAQSQRAVARDGAAPSTPEWTNPSETALERWAAERDELSQSGQYASRQYLPSELSGYAATFDHDGSWQNDETYGAVWYPTNTAEDWRPYYDGRWDYTPSYGWTWIASGGRWAYPTHHYGRWSVGSRGWFWIPSRHWGSAWVYWAVSPGYVGWCPLGWNGRPVLNVFNYDHAYASRWRDPYRAWTVIPRDAFGHSRVPRVQADRTRLQQERPVFVMQHRTPGIAPPRSPYPSPFNPRLNAGTNSGGGAPARGGVSTMSPHSYGRYGSTDDHRGGYAAPRDAASERDPGESPYDRARPYMPRPDRASADDGAVYHRTPSSESPTRSPNGTWRDRERNGDGERSGDGRGGPGYAGPRYRVPDSPGMSRPASGDHSPGMSDPSPGDRHAAPRDDPHARGNDDGDRSSRDGRDSNPRDSNPRDSNPRDSNPRDSNPRDSNPRESSPRDNGARPPAGDQGASRSGDGGGSRSSGGGAVRRHP